MALLRPLLRLVIGLLLAAGTLLPASGPRVVRVWVFPFRPGIFLDQDGRAAGFFVDILKETAAREGWTLEFRSGTWAEGMVAAEKDEVDLLTSVASTPERAQFLDFGKEPAFTVWSILYANPRANIQGIMDVGHRTIGLMKRDINGAHFRDLCSKFKIPCAFQEFGSFPEIMAAVAAGQVDAGVTPSIVGYDLEARHKVVRTPVVFDPFDLFFATHRGRNADVLAALDAYLKAGKSGADPGYQRAIQRWLSLGESSKVPGWVRYGALAAGALVLVLALTNLLFRRRVSRATAEVRVLNRRLEAELAHSRVYQQQLFESREKLQKVLDHCPGPVFWKDPDLVYLGCNPAFARATGHTDPTAVVGRTDLDVGWSPGDAAKAREADLDILKNLTPRLGQEEARTLADGSVAWYEVNKLPFFDDAGQLLGILGVYQDITSRKQAEDQVRGLNEHLEHLVEERTRQLQTAIREQEAFSYSVSHDLRAPLRAIDGFSRVLQEDYGARLDAEGLRCLSRVRKGTERMAQLIDDLLKLSQVSRSDLTIAPVDLSAEARRILEDLAASSPDRSVQTVVAPGLAAAGDPRLLGIVLANLLRNAWKYTAKTPDARIEFGAMAADGVPVFWVRDNGAGFDMAYAGKLFQAFQRLHGGQDYEGNGIGLALVQRIIHRHRGRVWAEAEPGRGATFFFTLPRPA